ncbi:NlpC/P60 family protein [Mycobacterium sp. NPDC050041]|uniref:NlpC/P60 family protein n=1 Tax=Mycobacterium sp. NPDC050041 TaxID=3364293 RepID=UPI003C2AEA30
MAGNCAMGAALASDQQPRCRRAPNSIVTSLDWCTPLQSGAGRRRAAGRNLRQPGDIATFYADVSHAGIYIGDGMMVHASTYGTPVRVAPIHNARRD